MPGVKDAFGEEDRRACVPLLSLGIPGSGTTAVLLGAFLVLGIQPGPLLVQDEGTEKVHFNKNIKLLYSNEFIHLPVIKVNFFFLQLKVDFSTFNCFFIL